jgi:hypothetical protein
LEEKRIAFRRKHYGEYCRPERVRARESVSAGGVVGIDTD